MRCGHNQEIGGGNAKVSAGARETLFSGIAETVAGASKLAVYSLTMASVVKTGPSLVCHQTDAGLC